MGNQEPVALLLLLSWIGAFICSEDCYNVQYVTCENLSMTLEVDESISDEVLRNENCDHGLYYQNDTFFADPMHPEKYDMVEEVMRRSVKIRACPAEVLWKVKCASPMFERLVCYKVNETNPGHVPSPTYPRGHWPVIIPAFAVVILVLIVWCKGANSNNNKKFENDVTVVQGSDQRTESSAPPPFLVI